MMKKKITLGVLFGSREFFPASLVSAARTQMFAALDELGVGYVALDGNNYQIGRASCRERV